MESIIDNKKECFRCRTTQGLHKHHIFFGVANRRKSDEDGCWIWLCGKHHNLSNDGIHFNKDFDTAIKQLAEQRWIDHYDKSKEDFLVRYGRNYLD